MSKYDPLYQHLKASELSLELTFADVEEILGFKLPPSARKHEAWWSNSGGSHVQSYAWLNAGYRTESVDVPRGTVRFVPDHAIRGFGEMKQTEFEPVPKTPVGLSVDKDKPAGRHPIWGIWKGLVTLDPDYDYTQPADPEWAKVYGE
jgi:hypothetical protein